MPQARHYTASEIKPEFRGKPKDSLDLIVVGRFAGNFVNPRIVHFESGHGCSSDGLLEMDEILARYDGISQEAYHEAIKKISPYLDSSRVNELLESIRGSLLISPEGSMADVSQSNEQS